MSPSVAVVIPARDEERYLRGALASCLEQSAALEVVVVDNASRDGTAAVADAFAREHPDLPLRVVREPVAGRARAKDRGASEACGRVLLFLDADSRMDPDLAARVVAHHAAGLLSGDIRIVADSLDPLDRAFFWVIDLKRLFRIRAQMFYCDRALFETRGGFDERLQIGEDEDFLARLQASGVRVGHVAESAIHTSPRRLRSLPLRLGMLTTFGRWALAHAGIGRRWRY